MTFSNEVKYELSTQKIESKLLALLELSSILRVNASISIRNAFINIDFTSESEHVIKRIYSLIDYLYKYESTISKSENNSIQKEGVYHVSIEDEKISERLLSDSGIDIFGNNLQSENILYSRIMSNPKGSSAVLRGVFLGSGSIVDPNKNYHTELVFNNEYDAKVIEKILLENAIEYLVSNRKEKIIIYIKNSETIATLLNIMGAIKSFFKLEDIKVEKELRNNINRKMNFDMANLNKTIETSLSQIDAINKLEELGAIPQELKEIASLRKENPEASLKELVELSGKKISKTNLAYKLNKLKNLAENI